MVYLQNRTIKVTFCLNEAERAHLKDQAAKAGLPVEPFLRRLVMGVELRSRPPAELTEILRQLSAIGNNTNQIAASPIRQVIFGRRTLKPSIPYSPRYGVW